MLNRSFRIDVIYVNFCSFRMRWYSHSFIHFGKTNKMLSQCRNRELDFKWAIFVHFLLLFFQPYIQFPSLICIYWGKKNNANAAKDQAVTLIAICVFLISIELNGLCCRILVPTRDEKKPPHHNQVDSVFKLFSLSLCDRIFHS